MYLHCIGFTKKNAHYVIFLFFVHTIFTRLFIGLVPIISAGHFLITGGTKKKKNNNNKHVYAM